MKSIALFALIATTSALRTAEDDGSLHFFDFNNANLVWKNDWEAYRNIRDDGDSNNCRLAESDNWYGAQQCRVSWECRGARMCERGGFCSGYDGCEVSPLPMQAPGLLPDC